jgi:aspartate/methionine/tyrosine aminotransferase
LDEDYTNTELERLALRNEINLSDGHARHDLSPAQRGIIADALARFDEARARRQEDIELEFLEWFLKCAGQSFDGNLSRHFLSYSSSSAISLAAQFCRMRGQRVLLIEPCFDNIRHLLITHGVDVCAVSELELLNLQDLRKHLDSNTAVWLVQPNNPTGFCLDESRLVELAKLTATAGATIIIDFAFRFFAKSLYEWQQYKAFEAIGVDYLCIEDTGKTWPIADLKVGLTICSIRCAPLVHTLHDQLLLNVSPLVLLILRDFLRDSFVRGVASNVRVNVDRNRTEVRKLIELGLVEAASPACENTPLELLTLPGQLAAMDLWRSLRACGVDILPAKNYYWSNTDFGHSQFRVPLLRPHADILRAVPIIETTLRGMLRA